MDVGVVDPAATRELRRTVLRPGRAPGDPLPGDDLPDAVHLGAWDDDGRMLGTCFVYADPCPWRPELAGAWHLRQMATVPDRRGEGIGARVLAAALDQVRARGAPLLWCHARATAAAFYARHGFERVGEVFIDAEHPIPHLRMHRELGGAATSS